MVRSELSIDDRIGQFKIRLRLLVALQHEHATAQVVVNRGCIDRITTKSLLSNFSGFQEAFQRPGWLVNVIEDGSQTTVGEGLIGMVGK